VLGKLPHNLIKISILKKGDIIILTTCIRISELAFIQLCLYSLEAYIVGETKKDRKKIKQKKFLETFGHLFGHQTEIPDKRKIYQIDFVSIDTSAERKENSVRPDLFTFRLKLDFISSFAPQYEYLGEFHTHTYPKIDYKDIIKENYHHFSANDYITTISKANLCGQYRIAIVISITTLKKRGWKSSDYVKGKYNTLEFTLGNYRLWVKGYAAITNEENEVDFEDEIVLLICPSVSDWMLEAGGFSTFGKEIKAVHVPTELPK
jgi:hypothetical protein